MSPLDFVLQTETLMPFESLLSHHSNPPLPASLLPEVGLTEAAKRYALLRKREGLNGSNCLRTNQTSFEAPFCLFLKQIALKREARQRKVQPRESPFRHTLGSLSLQNLSELELPIFKKTIQRFRNQFPSKFMEQISTLLDPLRQKPGHALFVAALLEEHLPTEPNLRLVLEFYKIATTSALPPERERAHYRLALLQILAEQYLEARPSLDALMAGEHDHDYRSRAIYWRSVVAEALDESSLAASLRKKILTQYPLSVHAIYVGLDHGFSHESQEELNLNLKVLARVRTEKGVHAREVNQRLEAIEALLYLEELTLAKEALDLSIEAFEEVEPETKLYISFLASRMKHFLATFRLLSGAFRENRELITYDTMSLYYPTDVVLHEPFLNFSLDPALMTSLIRQESAFQAQAVSHAGAVGLMQVMPKTARKVQRTQTRQTLMDPVTNLNIGSRFFRSLLDEYSGDVEFALAAYNAGSNRVTDWQRRYVTPDKRLFVDLIPFKETREYIASIARNYYWYTLTQHQDKAKTMKALQEKFVIFKKH
jgi:hypothetical protein